MDLSPFRHHDIGSAEDDAATTEKARKVQNIEYYLYHFSTARGKTVYTLYNWQSNVSVFMYFVTLRCGPYGQPLMRCCRLSKRGVVQWKVF